ncbi:hypothetical protein BBJ28_00012438 [Nothophytophthora sp. Chile5]|nr:hypothetical protein BBJ28_00012438 [Nothophytophthora sp. Chile5]
MREVAKDDVVDALEAGNTDRDGHGARGAVEACLEELHGAFYANILLAGGNVKFRNFQTRLERDLRTLVLDAFELYAHTPSE